LLDWEEFVYKREHLLRLVFSAHTGVKHLIVDVLWAKFRHLCGCLQQWHTVLGQKSDFDVAVPVGDRDDCIVGIEAAHAETIQCHALGFKNLMAVDLDAHVCVFVFPSGEDRGLNAKLALPKRRSWGLALGGRFSWEELVPDIEIHFVFFVAAFIEVVDLFATVL